MRTALTVNEIKTEMEILYRNVTGKRSFTAIESDIVYASIVDAYQFVLLEYGIDTFKFQEVNVAPVTVAEQAYIDLDEYIYRILPGTVRIPSEGVLLSLADEEAIFAQDPNLEETGTPSCYSIMAQSDVDIVRVRLWPIPDQVFTLALSALKFPEDSISSFPTSLTSAIKYKAKSLSCIGLGIPNNRLAFDQAYEDIIGKVKNGFNGNAPKHIGRTYDIEVGRSIEGRIP